jgi:hypothetical protein
MQRLRHDRQARLAEVGSEGQARIARSVVAVPSDGFAAEVAVRYLAGAGVARVRVGNGALAEAALAVDPAVSVEIDDRMPAEDAAIDLPLRDPIARELAGGAFRALRALRAALDGAS